MKRKDINTIADKIIDRIARGAFAPHIKSQILQTDDALYLCKCFGDLAYIEDDREFKEQFLGRFEEVFEDD